MGIGQRLIVQRGFILDNPIQQLYNAIKLKYSLIRYYYTEIFKVSLLEKGGLFKPVFYSFPYDNNSYENKVLMTKKLSTSKNKNNKIKTLFS